MALWTAPALATLCFLPGMGGLTDAMRGPVKAQLRERGIDLVNFDVPKNATFETQAEAVQRALEAKLATDPDFTCDAVGHSGGGILGDYAYQKLLIKHPTRGPIPLGQIFKSFTTIGSPHRGTPASGKLAALAMPWAHSVKQMSLKGMQTFRNIARGGGDATSESSTTHANDTQTPNASTTPEGRPATPARLYSYRLGDNHVKHCGGFFERTGLRFLRYLHPIRLSRKNSDGLVPTDSQDYGTHIADLKTCHSFFSKFHKHADPSIVDFYEFHTALMTGKLRAYRDAYPDTYRKFRDLGFPADEDLPAGLATPLPASDPGSIVPTDEDPDHLLPQRTPH